MPTLRIPFPENEAPTPVALRGDRITIGRLPDNAIQVRDRTISAHHAELIVEGDHYRLHDLGSTNGITVDGQTVTDFHLRDACRISIGSIECEFTPDGEDAADKEKPAILTHAEAEAVLREKGDLLQQLAVAREQIERLQEAHATDVGATVPQADFDRVVAELAATKELLTSRDRDLERLKADLAVLRRDRDHLLRTQNGAAGPKPGEAELATEKRVVVPLAKLAVPAPAVQPTPPVEPEAPIAAQVDPAEEPATQPSLPKPSLPKPTSLPLPKSKPAFVPQEANASPVPPSTPSMPSAPAPAAPQVLPRPTRLIAAAANGGSGGMRPFPAAPGGNPNAPKGVPVPVLRKATPAAPAATAGPKGTQKIS